MTTSNYQAQEAILARLQSACAAEDAVGLEHALNDAYRTGLSEDFAPILTKLCRANWHTRHEDVVSALQEIGGTSAIEPLEEAAIVDHPYLAYDEHFALARKATWALADIGGDEAKAALMRIAASTKATKAAFANKRLRNWETEFFRKRNR